MNNQAVEYTNNFQREIAELKKDSPYYPDFITKSYPDERSAWNKIMAVSTLVRIKRNDLWYTVHCVEKSIIKSDFDIVQLLTKLMNSAYKIQNLYVLTGKHEDIDILQIDEQERIKINESTVTNNF